MTATTTADDLDPQLAAAVERISRLPAALDQLLDGVTPEQASWRPEPNRWSIADCIDHLNITNASYIESLGVAIPAARAAGRTGTGPFRYNWLNRWFINNLPPPPRRSFPAPKRFRPSREHDLAALVADYKRHKSELAELAAAASGLNLAGVKVPSPASKLIRISIGAVFEIMDVHDRRHLWQAEQVKSAPGLPGSV